MEEKINQFIKEFEFVKNEHGVFLYTSKDGSHSFNLKAMLEDFCEFKSHSKEKQG